MSHSSAEVTYRPAGPGHRTRTAHVDLTRIPDPEAWLTNRLGSLASFESRQDNCAATGVVAQAAEAARLEALVSRLTASMKAVLAARHAALDALAARLEATAPAGVRLSAPPKSTEEIEA